MADQPDPLEITETSRGIVIAVQAQPKARRPGIMGIHAGRLKVAVSAAPEHGKANDAIIRLLAESIGLKRQQVELTAGASSSHKRFLLIDVDRITIKNRIDSILHEARISQ
ncbi:MAG: DUF167 domain-containing protein [Planctomycetota bacterium]|nr:DUF167 domain-containing protein [Planctomycetota bacterium]MDA1212254.1 DUF167 domain-containing protein [Planctomycetota bacterium]